MSFYKTGTYLISSTSWRLKHVLASILEGRAVSFVWIAIVRTTSHLHRHPLTRDNDDKYRKKKSLVSSSVTQSWYSSRNLGKFKKVFDEILLGMTVLPLLYEALNGAYILWCSLSSFLFSKHGGRADLQSQFWSSTYPTGLSHRLIFSPNWGPRLTVPVIVRPCSIFSSSRN